MLPPRWQPNKGPWFSQGPIDWLIEGLENVGIGVPTWLADTPAWLHQAQHSWVLTILPIVTALCGTCLVKAQRSSGLVVFGVIALLLSVQATMNLLLVAWTVLWALIPVGIALIIAAAQVILPPPPG